MATPENGYEAYYESQRGIMDEPTRRENLLLERYRDAERSSIASLEAERSKLNRPWHRKRRRAIEEQIAETKADFFNERTKIIESAEFARQREWREWMNEPAAREQAELGLDERGQVVDQAHAAPDTIDPEPWVHRDDQEQAAQAEPAPEDFEPAPEVDEVEPEQPAHEEPAEVDTPEEPDYVQRAREQHERDREIQRQRELAQQEQEQDGPGGL